MRNPAMKLAALVLCLTLVMTVGSFAAAADDNVLRVHIETEVQSLDPQVATDGTSFEVIADFTDGLYQMDASSVAVPALAAETTISDDGLTYTFKIRDDAFWSNGDPVTADDFVFGWQRACDPAFASEYVYMITDIGQIKNSKAVYAGEMPVDRSGRHRDRREDPAGAAGKPRQLLHRPDVLPDVLSGEPRLRCELRRYLRHQPGDRALQRRVHPHQL